ncbi:MAG TPA: response regulator, partial [Chroococcales cyanobacterium]
LIWQEILGYVSDGEYTVEQLVQAGAAAPPPRKDAAMKLIALAPAMDRNMLDESCRAVGFTVDHAPDLHSVFSNQRLYDAALLDLHCVPPQNIYNIVGALRTTSGASAQMPFALVASNDAPLTLPDLIYTGCSAYIEQPDDSQCVGDALRFLWKDSNNAKQHVLCIDDDPMLTKFVDSVLSGAGYSVKSITEPITVLDVLEEFTPDLIVLDVVMPGLTGYEVCRMLRAHERWSHVPIIFLTCKSNAAGRAAAFEAGGTDFLAKPVLAEELLARINMHLALQESKRSFVGLLPKDQFEKQSQILAKSSQKSGLPSTLVLVQIAEPNLVAQTGPAGMDHVAPMLEQLLALRFRQSDLRCKWSNGLYAVFMPGLDADCAQDVLGCLCSDWLHIWSMDKNANMNRLNVSAAAMNGSSRSIADLVEEAGLSLRNVVEIAGEIVTRKETQLDCSWR